MPNLNRPCGTTTFIARIKVLEGKAHVGYAQHFAFLTQKAPTYEGAFLRAL